ncbi:MAG TPA: flagellar hook-associated protein FlgK [Candidatus Acidoferrales bacterium]|jgi:flagellar hook-associated protein 1 FlgK|nr:flagellar hook-associated protein FlgK [Candidatus Acidoferrales bacterium]
MGSLGGALSIVLGSLSADEGAINVTTNNLANANTPGYDRQVVQFSENDPIVEGNLVIGTGVTLQQAQTVRSNVLQVQLNQETQTSGQLNSFVGGMTQVESLFNETSGTGLQTPLSAFFSSMQQLSTNPSSSSLRVGVISAAQNLATAFNQSSSALTTQQSDLNLSVQQSVTQVNTLSGQVAQLNNQITSMTESGEDPSALIEQRDTALQSLSNVIGINVIAGNNNSITVTTGNGAPLLVGSQSFALQTQTNTTTGMQDVYSQGQDITSQITGGQLGGQIQVRDQQIPSVLNQIDTLASSIENAVNTQSQAGYDLNGNAGVNLFTTPPAGVTGSAAAMGVAITDPSLVAASSDGTSGSNGNANALAAIANQGIVGGQTASDYYSGTVFQIGNAVSNATAEQTAAQGMTQQLQNQIGALSGVSLNEEAANLTQFQQAYDASARVVTIISELTQEAINLGQD